MKTVFRPYTEVVHMLGEPADSPKHRSFSLWQVKPKSAGFRQRLVPISENGSRRTVHMIFIAFIVFAATDSEEVSGE